MPKPEVTGTTLLRDAMYARRQSAAVIARDELGIPSDHLASFISGTRTLPPDVLCKLALHIFGGAVEYVPALDKLRAVSTAPTMTMSAYPPRWVPTQHQKPIIPTRGPKPVKPVKPTPKTARPGWV